MCTTKSAIPAIALDFPIVVGAGRLADFRNTAKLHLNTGRGFGVISFSWLEGLLERIMASPWAYPPHMTMDTPHSDSPQAWAGYHQLNKNLMLFEHLTPSLGVAEEDDDEEAEGGGGGAAARGPGSPPRRSSRCPGRVYVVTPAVPVSLRTLPRALTAVRSTPASKPPSTALCPAATALVTCLSTEW